MIFRKHNDHIDFLSTHVKVRRSRVLEVARIAALALGVALAFSAILAVPFAFSGYSAYRNVMSGRVHLEDAQSHAERLDFAAAGESVDEAHDDFTSALRSVRRFGLFASLPYVGTFIETSESLLASGTAATSAASRVFSVAAGVSAEALSARPGVDSLSDILPDESSVFSSLSRDEKRKALGAVSARRDEIRSALDDIDRAIEAFDGVPRDKLPVAFAAPLSVFRDRLVSARTALSASSPFLELAPSVLGYEGKKRYLIFYMNNTELRPTGGFLGVFGVAEVQDAELVNFATDDIYALDGPSESEVRPPAPTPIQRYAGVRQWYLRDANWSPDFPTSAELMERFYLEEARVATSTEPEPIDGIVAFTPNLAEEALRLVGPVTVSGKTFTAENLVDDLEFEVERGFVQEGIPRSNRKDIVGELSRAVIDKMLELPLGSLLAFATTLEKNMEEEHVLFAMKDPKLQSIIKEHEWAGAMRSVKIDYAKFVDANIAALKSDPFVDRSIRYEIEPSGDTFVATARIMYDHRGQFEWKTTRYRTYTRLYVPAGSKLLGVEGAMHDDKIKDPSGRPGVPDEGEELGRKWFGAFISIEPKAKGELAFRYEVSPSVAASIRRGEYELRFEKQAGTNAHGLTLDLNLGKNLTNAKPQEPRSEWGDSRYRYSTDLRVDREFDVDLLR